MKYMPRNSEHLGFPCIFAKCIYINCSLIFLKVTDICTSYVCLKIVTKKHCMFWCIYLIICLNINARLSLLGYFALCCHYWIKCIVSPFGFFILTLFDEYANTEDHYLSVISLHGKYVSIISTLMKITNDRYSKEFTLLSLSLYVVNTYVELTSVRIITNGLHVLKNTSWCPQSLNTSK